MELKTEPSFVTLFIMRLPSGYILMLPFIVKLIIHLKRKMKTKADAVTS